MSRKFAWTMAAVVLATPSVGGGDSVKLAWNFDVGDKFLIERTVKHKQSLEARMKTSVQHSSNRWLSSVLVKKKDTDGYLLELVIDTVERTITEGTSKPATDKLAAKMKGAKFTITMTPQGKIAALTGYDEFVKQLLVGQKEEYEKVLRILLPEEIIRDALEEVFAWLPPQPVSTNRWKRQAREPVGEFGHFLLDYDLTYRGNKDGLRHVVADIAARFVTDPDPNKVIKVNKAELKTMEGTASFSMGPDGKSMEGTRKLVLKGPLELGVGNKHSSVNLVSETVVTMRVFTEDDKKK